MRVITTSLDLQEDNYGYEDSRVFIEDLYNDEEPVVITVPAKKVREMGNPTEISVQISPIRAEATE